MTSLLMPMFTGTGLAMVVVLAVAGMMAPRWSRLDIFFSVTVDTSLRGSERGRKILRDFSRWVLVWGMIGLGIVLPGFFMGDAQGIGSSLLLVAGVVVELAGITLAYAAAHRRAMQYRVAPSTEREAAMGPRQLFTTKLWLILQTGPFLVLLLAAFWLWRHWDNIPERYPIHWGMDGNANGWGDRSFRSVFIFPILGMMTCALFCGLLNGLARGIRRVHSSGPTASKESQNLKNALLLLLGVEYSVAVIFGAASMLPLIPSVAKSNGTNGAVMAMAAVSAVMSLVVIAAAMLLAARNGQGGWRLAGAEAAMKKSPPAGDRTPDECWKGGIIYYNPDDPAVWVEKRFGYGWTVNMANPRAWAVVGGILFFSLGTVVLSLVLSHK